MFSALSSAMATYLKSVESLRQLAASAPLWGSEPSCLAIRFPESGCRRCVEVCPVEVLQCDGERLSLRGECLGCGRCAALCPSWALVVPGFSPPPAVAAGATLRLDCERVPPTEEADLRLPCLGGVRSSQLLAWLAEEPERRVELLDRGWCGGCPAGGGAADAPHPAAPVLRQTQMLLREVGLVPERLALVAAPLPPPAYLAATPAEAAEVDRRGFMRQLLGRVTQGATQALAPSLPATIGEAPAVDGRARIAPLERLRQVAHLQRLAGEAATPRSLLFFPEIDPQRCRHHRLCATICPVAALEQQEQVLRSRLLFHAQRCLGCQLCARGCPEQALQIRPAVGAELTLQPQALEEQPWRDCGYCGRPFLAGAGRVESDEQLPCCPNCARSQGFVQALFEQPEYGAQHPSSSSL